MVVVTMLSLMKFQLVPLERSNSTYNAMPVDGGGPAHGRVRQLIVNLDLGSCEHVYKGLRNTTYIQFIAFSGIDRGAMKLTEVRIGGGEIGKEEQGGDLKAHPLTRTAERVYPS